MQNTVCALTLNPAIDKTVYVDDFTLNEVNRAGESSMTSGSKGINVARVLAKCGLRSVCSGFIGMPGGGYILDEISKDGVVADFVEVDYDVRTNIKLVDLKNSTYTDINFDGNSPSEADMAALGQKLRMLARESMLVALGGSLPKGVDSATYYRLALAATEEGAAVSADCYGEPFLQVLKAKPCIVKPNLQELELTYKESYDSVDDIAARAMKIYEGGVENVLVSLGGEGAICVCGGDVLRVYTDDLSVYNTVGAGDAFLSGFIYGWSEKMSAVDCLKHSASFSQAVVSSRAGEAKDFAALTRYLGSARVEIVREDLGGVR